MTSSIRFVTAVLVPLSAPLAQTLLSELPAAHMPFDLRRAPVLAFGDVDRDGDSDLFVGGELTPAALYRNDGQGTFVKDAAPLFPVAVNAAAWVDLDRDGDLDLVVGADRFGSRAYRNNNGQLTDATSAWGQPGLDDVLAYAVGDVDRDGDPDLITADASGTFGQQTRLYLNDGSGRLLDMTANMPNDWGILTLALSIGDVDGDNDLDLVLGTFGQDRLYLNDGSGTFTNATTGRMPAETDATGAQALADLDADGDLDLILGQQIAGTRSPRDRLYLNDGSGTFQDATATLLPADQDHTEDLTLIDVDSDGDLDLVAAAGFDQDAPRTQDRLYLNDGQGKFTPSSLPVDYDESLAVAAGDVDGDNDADLVFARADQQVGLYFNDGTGAFTDAAPARIPRLDRYSILPALADLDGDGTPELLASGSFQSPLTHWFRNDTRGAFTLGGTLAGSADNVTTIAAADIDGDGDLDVALGCSTFPATADPRDRLYRNDGNGVLTDVTVAQMPLDQDTNQGMLFCDVDRDGDADLVLAMVTTGAQLYLNDGTGMFTDVSASHMPVLTEVSGVACGDVDGDGDADVLLGNPLFQFPTGRDYLLPNDGTGRFTDGSTQLPLFPGLQASTVGVVLADLDLDGDLDAVLRRKFSSQFDVLLVNDGAGQFSDATAGRPFVGSGDTTLLVADIDLNGAPDLLIGGRAMFNDGSASFSDLTSRAFPAALTSDTSGRFRGRRTVGDVDRDGDIDVVFPGRVLLNCARQVDVPLRARVGQSFALDAYVGAGFALPGYVAFPFANTVLAQPPIPLPPFGLVGLHPVGLIAWPAMPVSAPAGRATLTFAIPAIPAFAGETLAIQALAVTSPNSTTWRLSNVSASVVLR